MRKIVLLLALVCAFSLTAGAQRTTKGSSIISAYGTWTISSFGGQLEYGQYMLNSFWFGGVSFNERAFISDTFRETVFSQRAMALGGYMWRLLGARNRMLNFYGGADAFIGAGFFDVFKVSSGAMREYYNLRGETATKFIYGFSPRLELECYIGNHIAIVALARGPLCINDRFSHDLFSFEGSLGVRVNF